MTPWLKVVETVSPVATAVLVVATVVLFAAIVAHRVLRRSPAAGHAIVLAALLAIGLCPLMVTIARPAGAARLTSFLPNSIKFDNRISHVEPAELPIHDNGRVSFSSSRQFPLAGILFVFWGIGTTVCLARLMLGLHTMSRVRGSGVPMPMPRAVSLRNDLVASFGRNPPEIQVSERVGVPVALGLLRPNVLLPSSFLTRFDDRQLFQILVHECAHSFRYDMLVGLYQRVLTSLLWFHPLIHVANRLLDRSREELCDNYVLRAVPPAEYSRTLLTVAQILSPMPNGWFAPTLIQSARQLENRVARLLNPRRSVMTKLKSATTIIIAAAFIGGAFVLSCFAAAPTDEQAIRATITNYIEAYYTGDGPRMEESLHPHYLKHTISGSGEELRMTEWTGLQMIQDVRSHVPKLSASEKEEQITVLDISSDMASAKLVTTYWVDYMVLSKWNGQWKIVSVVLRQNDHRCSK